MFSNTQKWRLCSIKIKIYQTPNRVKYSIQDLLKFGSVQQLQVLVCKELHGLRRHQAKHIKYTGNQSN